MDRDNNLITAAKWFYALPDLKEYRGITRELAFQKLSQFPEYAGKSPEQMFAVIAKAGGDETNPIEPERVPEEKPKPQTRYFKDPIRQPIPAPQPEPESPSAPTAVPGLGTIVRSRLKYYILAGVLAIVFVMYIADDLSTLMFPEENSQEGDNQQNAIQVTQASSALDYCSFTYRGKQVAIKSRKLVSIFQEVSALTKVPAAVLASVAVHESNVFSTQAEDTHDAFSSSPTGIDCLPHFPTSPTGALGLMQIQAPSSLQPKGAGQYNPNAFSKEGVEIGLKFLGRDLSSLTLQDFCDIKTNVILGAGVLIAKNGGSAPQTIDEITQSVCRYYGVCSYGEFNYGGEVAGDFNNCRLAANAQLVSTSTQACPIPNGQITCGSLYTPINSCGHCGLNYTENMSICASFPATKYAIDIAAKPGEHVSLPKIAQQNISWSFDHQEAKSTDAIQIYSGVDIQSGKKYILQLHHTQPGSGSDTGAVICRSCNHVHVQIGETGTSREINWLDSANYLCKRSRESV